jgi:lipopolysaccharide biosynthesis regulator YciM
MQRRFWAASLVVALAAFSLTFVGCGQVNKLKAKKAYKEANMLYQQQDYKRAAERYEEVVVNDDSLMGVYFFLGNSYDNLYKPSRKGEAQNDAYLTKAVEAYKKGVQVEQDKTLKTRCLQYLVAAYGPDKLADPSQAEPLLLEMIKIDPKETANYVILAKMYEDAGQYDLAEQTLLKAKEASPGDGGVYQQLASYYNRQGEFDKTMAALNEGASMDPKNPVGYYTIAQYYWEKAYRDFRLKKEDKLNYINLGLEAADKALAIQPDYMDAIKSKELLFRAEALNVTDQGKIQQLLKDAGTLSDRYNELKKKKAGGL